METLEKRKLEENVDRAIKSIDNLMKHAPKQYEKDLLEAKKNVIKAMDGLRSAAVHPKKEPSHAGSNFFG